MLKSSRTKYCPDCRERSPLFNLLTASELELMDQNRYEVVFNPGEVILKKGTPGTHVLSFNKGLAKFYLEGKDRNIIIRLIKPGEVLSGPGSFVETMHLFGVAALETTCVCFIDSAIFQKVMGTNAAFREAFLKMIHNNLVTLIEKLVSLNQKQSQGRLAEALLYLSNKIYESNPFTLTLSKTDLANLAGISKESAFKILKELDQDGVISRDQSVIKIHKPDLLEKISSMG